MRHLLTAPELKAALLACLLLAGCRTGTADSETDAVFDAQGNKIPDAEADGPSTAWRPLVKGTDEISGVGVLGVHFLFSVEDVCTAMLLDTGNDDGPAYLLSNAHCTFFEHWGFDPLGATEFRVDQPIDYYVSFNHFVAVPKNERVQFKLKRMAYITEFGTDMAVLEIDAKLKDLKAQQIKPLKLSRTRPPEGLSVRLVGIPLMHVDPSRSSLHISSCKVGRNAVLQNGIYSAPNSVAHKCSSVEGFSGGPFLSDAGEVVLLNSHGAGDGSTDEPCSYATRPCEVLANGEKKVWSDLNFAQYVDGLAGCFGADGRFNLSLPECHLPK